MDNTEERLYEAELYRLKGELTLQVHGQNLESEAEASFQKALDSRPQARSEILGTPRGHESGAPVAATREENEARDLLAADLQLVHRRV